MSADQRLSEEQTRRAQTLEAVGRLAGDVAHDFNNLLSVMLGCSEIALRQLHAADPLHALIEQVHKATQRAAQLTRQLLACNRERILAPAPWGNETILLVVHDDAVRTLAAIVLHGHGYEVLEADNFRDATQLGERPSTPIDLLVVDADMPGMSGPQLAATLTPQMPALKALYLCGQTGDGGLSSGALDAGAPFLHKPFAPEALAQTVRDVLDGKSPGRTDIAN